MNQSLNLLSNIKEKDIIEVEYNINGREVRGSVYNNLHITKVNLVKEFVVHLFNSNDIELPEANDFDFMEDELENE